MGPSVLRTENLILQVENESNAGAVLELYKRNKEIFDRYEPTRPINFFTKDFHFQHLIREHKSYTAGDFLRYFIYTHSSYRKNKIIGSVNFNIKNSNLGKYAEIGYKLDLLYQNRGIAYEACINGINVMQEYYGINLFAAHIAPDNVPSIKLAQKLGFRINTLKALEANVNGRDILLDLYILDTSDTQ
ncbi:MAG: GNAT family N-acetyltransferase [Lachnospiraceae bacterium]|nr:GNAT family N-acetyltransferase [Lachnospiraceae bacterium]